MFWTLKRCVCVSGRNFNKTKAVASPSFASLLYLLTLLTEYHKIIFNIYYAASNFLVLVVVCVLKVFSDLMIMSSFLTRTRRTPPYPSSTLLYQFPSLRSLSFRVRSSFVLWFSFVFCLFPLRMTSSFFTLIRLTPSSSTNLLYQTPSFAFLRTSKSLLPSTGLLTTSCTGLSLALRSPALSSLTLCCGLVTTLLVWVVVRCLVVGISIVSLSDLSSPPELLTLLLPPIKSSSWQWQETCADVRNRRTRRTAWLIAILPDLVVLLRQMLGLHYNCRQKGSGWNRLPV